MQMTVVRVGRCLRLSSPIRLVQHNNLLLYGILTSLARSFSLGRKRDTK